MGSGIGSLQTMEREYDRLKEKGPNKVSPMMVPLMISNMAAGNVSIAYGLKGKSLNVVTACATGTHSIGEAFRTIQYGMQISWWQEEQKVPLHPLEYRDLRRSLLFLQATTLQDVPFLLTRTEAVL